MPVSVDCLASVFFVSNTVFIHCLQSNNENVSHQHPGENELPWSLPSTGDGSHTVSVSYSCMCLPLSSIQCVAAVQLSQLHQWRTMFKYMTVLHFQAICLCTHLPPLQLWMPYFVCSSPLTGCPAQITAEVGHTFAYLWYVLYLRQHCAHPVECVQAMPVFEQVW